MEKIITIGENTRIKIIPENFMLQYEIKKRNKRIAWHTDGRFPSLESSYEEYLNNAPCHAIQTTENFKRMIEAIKTVKANLRKVVRKNTRKIILIGKGKNAKITITPRDHILQYRIKTENKQIAWHRGEYFPDLVSLAEEYLNNAPCRAIQATEDFKKLIEVVKTAETNFRKAIEKVNQ